MMQEGEGMECEICGRTVAELLPVNIEGSIMRVCSYCARFGERVKEKKEIAYTATKQPKLMFKTMEESKELELLKDYPSIIKASRIEKGMTQEQFGKFIGERESVVNRIESGKMEPDTKLIHKLERILGVKIAGKLEAEKISSKKPVTKELTLGDVVEVKKK